MMSGLLSFREDLRRARDGRGATALARASREEIAWLAGLLDGEACFVTYSHSRTGGASHGKRYRYPAVQLVQTDRDLVERAARLMGGTVYSRPRRRPGHKPTYRITLQGWPAVDVMLAIRGWVGERRAAQIDELVAEYRGRPRSDGRATHCGKGHEFTQENTYTYPDGSRQCIACRQAYYRARGRPPRKSFPQLKDRDWLLRRYVFEGASAATLAKEIGCSAQTVLDAVRRHGFQAHPPGCRRHVGRLRSLSSLGLTVSGTTDSEIVTYQEVDH